MVLLVNVENGELTRLMSDGLPETPPEKRRFTSVSPNQKVEQLFEIFLTHLKKYSFGYCYVVGFFNLQFHFHAYMILFCLYLKMLLRERSTT